MGYKNENLKHRQGIAVYTHACPHCGDKKQYQKVPLMSICGKCNKIIKEKDIIEL